MYHKNSYVYLCYDMYTDEKCNKNEMSTFLTREEEAYFAKKKFDIFSLFILFLFYFL